MVVVARTNRITPLGVVFDEIQRFAASIIRFKYFDMRYEHEFVELSGLFFPYDTWKRYRGKDAEEQAKRKMVHIHVVLK